MTATPGRRRFLRQSAQLAALASAACASSSAPERPVPPAITGLGYRLVQDWTFGDTVVGDTQLREQFHTRYIYDGGRLDHLNDEWQRYRDNANHEFSSGRLALVARAPRGLVPGAIDSGMLRSRWAGEYGYYEGRIRVPAGLGLWAGFWLNPQDSVWPPEIDIMEIVDNGRDTTRHSFHFVHRGAGTAAPATLSRLDARHRYTPGSDFAAASHNFAVLWEPGRVRHFVDDVLVVDRPFDWLHRGGKPAGPAHVLLNLAVGGAWPGPPQRLADFPARLSVDFIRVWQA